MDGFRFLDTAGLERCESPAGWREKGRGGRCSGLLGEDIGGRSMDLSCVVAGCAYGVKIS